MSDKPNDFIDQYQAFVRAGLETWSRQFDPATQGAAASPSADIMGRMFSGLSGYGDWMRSMAAGEPGAAPFAMGGVPPFGQPGPVGDSPYGPPGAFPPGAAPFGYGPPPGAAPFGYGPPPGAAMPQPGTEQFDEWAKVAREALSMPAFGLTREQQEEQQALFRAWIDYAEHYARFQALLQGVNDRAGAALRDQPVPSDPESMRSVYDRWVNLAEENYGEAALSDEFREVYAALVNAQMRLKVLQQKQVERVTKQAGMPTRTEVDSLGERLQAMRRELRHMHGLVAEVEALRAEVAALRAGKAPGKKAGVSRRPIAAEAAPTGKKVAGKAKAVAKKGRAR
ncbi:polyhydroxyalkanoate synthesis regulator phasin [Luteibacter sp. HA06]